MAFQRGDISVIEKALTDYKLKAHEMNVGVNYMALDDERRRQEHLLRELREIEEEIASPNLRNSKLPHLASEVGMELNHNTKCLQYLTGISELERSIGEVADHFTERSVELSDPSSLNKDVITYKTLTDNVKSCWSYVNQLSALAQIHLKTSAEYHQFFHEANEIEAKLEKQLAIAQKAQKSASEGRSHKQASKMATEIQNRLNVMRNLWQRSMNLVRRSETIVPIRLRLGGVTKGVAIGDPSNRPVMVRALVSLTGPDYKIQKGEILRLMDNRQGTHLWRVQTSTGVVEVPAICFWITNSDAEATERAITIKQKCRKTWTEIIDLTRLRLYEVYNDLLNQFNSQEVMCSHEGALNMLFSDIQKLLITPVGQDGRLKSSLETFRNRVMITKRLERLESGDINLKESDIVQIRSPLLRLQDHILAAEQMKQDMKRLNDHIAEYLSQVENDSHQLTRALNHLSSLTDQNEEQLNDLTQKMEKLKKERTSALYSQGAGARIKVEQLHIPPQELTHKRSRSQPRMLPVVDAISSSTTSSSTTSEYDRSSEVYVRARTRRARSQVLRRDFQAQIGIDSRSAETQYADEGLGLSREPSRPQLMAMPPSQRIVQTQIGQRLSSDAVQVDSMSMDSFAMEIHDGRKEVNVSPSSDEGSHEYIAEVQASKLTKDRARRRYQDASNGKPKKSSSMTNLVHSATHIGVFTSERSTSPVKELTDCPNCRSRTFVTSQMQIGPIYSGSESYQHRPAYDIKSEEGPNQHRVSKRIQSGYPCLTERMNLYCQCDVIGIDEDETNTRYAKYQTSAGPRPVKQMNSAAQVGVIYSNAPQQVQIPETETVLSPNTIGVVYESPYGRRKSLPDLSTSSAMIETVPLEQNRYVSGVSMYPNMMSSNTQIGTLVTGSTMQTRDYRSAIDHHSKRIQTGYSQMAGRSNSSTQVGALYQEMNLDRSYMEINVEPGVIEPVAAKAPQLAAAPGREPAAGMSVQVTRQQFDGTTQISSILTHNEVQTRDLPTMSFRHKTLQTKPRRSASTPSGHFTSQTQVGPVLRHENLSPIGYDEYLAPIQYAEMRNVQSEPRAVKSKRIQSVTRPPAMNVEMQVGQLLQESSTQSVIDLDTLDDVTVAPTLLAVQQKAISMPNVGVAETQVVPKMHGKKVQVAISVDQPVQDRQQHHKKFQVNVTTAKEMYDVEVETMPFVQTERYDVSCDTNIQPENKPKKIQVSMSDDGIPDIPVMTTQKPLYAAMPTGSPVEVYEAHFVDTSCEALSDTQYFDAQCQCDAIKPVTMGKKLQVDTSKAPELVDAACDPVILVKMLGKKLQVEMEAPHAVAVQEPVSQYATVDTMCDATEQHHMFDVNMQTIAVEEQAPISVVNAPIPVQSAPPMQLFEQTVAGQAPTADTACEPLFETSFSDGFTQSERILGIGKKLQVAIGFDERDLPIYEIASLQAYSEEIPVKAPEAVYAQPLYAQQPAAQTEDRACDAESPVNYFDASVQSAEVQERPQVAVMGKKLQVTPAALSLMTTQTIYVETPPQLIQVDQSLREYAAPPITTQPAVATQDTSSDALEPGNAFDAGVQVAEIEKPRNAVVGKKLQVTPAALALGTSQTVFTEPVRVDESRQQFAVAPIPKVETQDSSCDAVESLDLFDAGIQVAELVSKPESVLLGKKLQVSPAPMAVMASQGSAVLPEVGPIRLEETKTVFAAPPPPREVVDTEDKACEAMDDTPVYDAGIQVAEVEKPRSVVVGKKLQVSPTPLSLGTSQTIFTEPIQVDEQRQQFAVSQIPKVETQDSWCEALDRVDSYDAGIQVTQSVEKKEPVVLGKKLQVSPAPMAVMTSQGYGFVQETTPIRMEETKKVFAAPPQREVADTEDKACDAISQTPLFDASVQVAVESEKTRAVVLGKKLQVSPSPLSLGTSQTVFTEPIRVDESRQQFAVAPIPKVETRDNSCEAVERIDSFDAGIQVAELVSKPVVVGKELQVSAEPMAVMTSQGYGFVQESASIRLEETKTVFAAPPPREVVDTVDKACDALAHASVYDASIQVMSLEPPKPQVLGKKLQVSSAQFAPEKPQAFDKDLQVLPTPLETTGVQSTLQPAPAQIVRVEETSRQFAAPPISIVTTTDKSCDAIDFVSAFDASVQVSSFAETKPVLLGKGLQVSPPPLTTTLIQTEEKEPQISVQQEQHVFAAPLAPKPETLGKKLQVSLLPEMADTVVQVSVTPLEIATVQVQGVQVEKPVLLGKKMQVTLMPELTETVVQTVASNVVPLQIATSQTAVSEVVPLEITKAQKEGDWMPAKVEKPVMLGKKLQVDLRTELETTAIQTDLVVAEEPKIVAQVPTLPVSAAPRLAETVDEAVDAKPLPYLDVTMVQTEVESRQPEVKKEARDAVTQSEEISKYGKKMQVVPAPMGIQSIQTYWEEEVPQVASIVKKDERFVESAPPIQVPKAPVTDTGSDPHDSVPYADVFTQCEIVTMLGKKMQVMPPSLEITACQSTIAEEAPVIAPVMEPTKVFAQPVLSRPPTEDKSCEPMLGILKADFSVQFDTQVVKPPSRSVRIQKGVGAFEGTRVVGTQYSRPEHSRSPNLSPILPLSNRVDWGIQVQPTTMTGTTQTLPEPALLQPQPETPVFAPAPMPLKHSENLFSFTRETKATVTSRRSRSGSSGLIPYKTQVFDQTPNLSVSVPSLVYAKTDGGSPATITDCFNMSNRTAASQVPRRYATRLRSKRSPYGRRNRSMDSLYGGIRTVPRHYISENNLVTNTSWAQQQQMELEQRCEECVFQCVRLIGLDKVAQMLLDTGVAGADPGLIEDIENFGAKRRRLQNARTQYTSTTTIACPYCYHTAPQMGAGEEEIYGGDEWDTMRSSYGSARHGSYKWISRTPNFKSVQTEPTNDEVDKLMKNRALSAYCSDYELQQSGINANFEENAAFTFVAWKTAPNGEDKLELDTVGRLLKLTLVGARVPGTGEVISAADAFYRGILRVIYMDDEQGVIMPLTTAINANAVIVERRFATGVGITFQQSPKKCPVECTTVWQTPNMRRRTYRVNYIRLNDSEQVEVSRAIEAGIIDQYSGEIVGVRAPPTSELGDPLLQVRESSVGMGDTMYRIQHPERFNIREAILNDIVSVDLIQPEEILLSEHDQEAGARGRGREDSISEDHDSNTDLDV